MREKGRLRRSKPALGKPASAAPDWRFATGSKWAQNHFSGNPTYRDLTASSGIFDISVSLHQCANGSVECSSRVPPPAYSAVSHRLAIVNPVVDRCERSQISKNCL